MGSRSRSFLAAVVPAAMAAMLHLYPPHEWPLGRAGAERGRQLSPVCRIAILVVLACSLTPTALQQWVATRRRMVVLDVGTRSTATRHGWPCTASARPRISPAQVWTVRAARQCPRVWVGTSWYSRRWQDWFAVPAPARSCGAPGAASGATACQATLWYVSFGALSLSFRSMPFPYALPAASWHALTARSHARPRAVRGASRRRPAPLPCMAGRRRPVVHQASLTSSSDAWRTLPASVPRACTPVVCSRCVVRSAARQGVHA